MSPAKFPSLKKIYLKSRVVERWEDLKKGEKARSIREENEKTLKLKKVANVHMFADNMLLYVENLNTPSKSF